MVNPKRIEQKLPLLVTDGPWFSPELDRNTYRLMQFKKRCPDRYVLRRNNILFELEMLRRDIDESILRGKKGAGLK